MGASEALLLAVHVTFTYVTIVAVDDVMIETRYGTLVGNRKVYQYGLYGTVTNVVDEFLGVPYAAPPVGSGRWQVSEIAGNGRTSLVFNADFEPPGPSVPWTGILNATHAGWVCPQMGIFHEDTQELFQNEDCLNLNIYTPYQASDPYAVYPVMVYIHGGSYEVGSGKLYTGQVLAQYGVVVVTINYRLGALGFLTTGTSALTGNYGIMDQIEALKWVHNNINRFRGDPGQVTVFGHSAGGSSVGLLLTIPAARGLFTSAIAQSGSAVASFSCHHEKDFSWYIIAVGQLFGCRTTSTQVIIDCLRRQMYTRIVNYRPNFPLFDPIDPEFRPVVDSVLIPDTPRNLLLRGDFARVPFMTGTVKEEFDNYFNGGARHRPQFDIALDRYVQRYIKEDPELAAFIRYQYTDWKNEDRLFGNDETYERGALLSDMHMVAPTVEIAEIVSSYQSPVYQYHFGGQESYHSVELNYVFGAPFSGKCADEMHNTVCRNATEKDRRHSQRVMQLWTNFAKYHNPTPPGHTVDIENWEEFDASNNRYMHLNLHESRMKEHLRVDQVAFWNVLLPGLIETDVSQPVSLNHYETQMWIFVGISLSLLIVIIVLLILLFKVRINTHSI